MNTYSFVEDSTFEIIDLYSKAKDQVKSISIKIAGTIVAVLISSNTFASEVIVDDNLSVPSPEYTNTINPFCVFTDGKIQTATSLVNENYVAASLVIDNISRLSSNWDGYGAASIDQAVISNVKRFLSTLLTSNCTLPNADSISPTPYGTVVLDIDVEKGMVSIEISASKLGFFTDFYSGHNYGSEGIITDFLSLPHPLDYLLA